MPPSLIGSTPKKASTQSRGNPPKVEDMEHHELVDLVKKLMEERSSKPPIPTPVKIKYQDKAPYDVLMSQFYGTKMEIEEKYASFGTRLEQKLNQVSL